MEYYDYEKMSREDLISLLRIQRLRTKKLEEELQNKDLSKNLSKLDFSFEKIMDVISEGVIVQNKQGEIIYSNKSSQEILKLTREQLFGRSFLDPYWKIIDQHGNILTYEEHPIQETFEKKIQISDFILGLIYKDEQITWIQLSTYPILKTHSNEVEGVISCFYDITEQVQTNKELIKYKDFMENALKATEMGIWSWNVQTNELEWSPELYKFLELDPEDYKISYEKYQAMIHPEDEERINQAVREALQSESGEYFIQHRILNIRNETVWIEIRGKVRRDQNQIPVKMEGTAINITEKIQKENALKSQAFLLNETGKIAKVGGWEIYVDTNEIFWTAETYNIFEIPEETEINIDIFLEVFQKKDQALLKRKIDLATFERLKFQEEFEISVGGKTKWVKVIGIPQVEFSRVTKIFGTVQDTTNIKQSERSLKQSEERFQTFYDLASEGICIFSSEYKILDTNPAFAYMVDYEPSSLIGKDLREYLTTESFFNLQIAISSGETFEDELFLLLVRKSKREIPTQTKYRMIYYKNEFVYIASFLDITFYKEAEYLRKLNAEISMQNELINKQKIELEHALKNLQETQAKLIVQEKLASLGQLIAGIAHEINNPVGAISASNKNNEDILASLKEELPEIIKIFTEDLELLSLFFEIYNQHYDYQQTLSSLELRQKKRELASLLKNYNIEDPYTVADIMVDLGIFNLEEKYLPIYKNLTILQFLFSFISLHRNNKIIQVAHTRTSKIIYALKNYSRVNFKGEKILTDIKENIETVLTLYYNQLKSTVEVVKEFEDLPKIYCYPEDLLQVWTNLIYNSLQAMQFHGKITIRTKKIDDMILVSITDTGHGIPESIQEKIFEPFFTTKPPGEGSGLGLDIVKRIIEKHSGKIEVKSKPGDTTFFVWLPIS